MAAVNKVILIGRLTRDPEAKTFQSGGKVANFALAVSNKRKNASTGQWDDHPMFIECKAFNRGEHGKTADVIEQYLKKGKQVYVEGKLDLEQWDDKTTGQKRSKHVVLVENVQFLDPKENSSGQNAPAATPKGDTVYDPPMTGQGGQDDEIPF